MGIPQTKRSLAAIFIGTDFPFHERSPELDLMKEYLLGGISVQLTPTDIPDGYGGRSRPEVVASFFVVDGAEYRNDMRAVHGEHATEIVHESVFQLGISSREAVRIMDALAAGCNTYLIPEEGDNVSGRYTLCVLAC